MDYFELLKKLPEESCQFPELESSMLNAFKNIFDSNEVDNEIHISTVADLTGLPSHLLWQHRLQFAKNFEELTVKTPLLLKKKIIAVF